MERAGTEERPSEGFSVGHGRRWEMKLGRKAEAGPGKLLYHARESGFIWEIFQVGSKMIPFCDLISER